MNFRKALFEVPELTDDQKRDAVAYPARRNALDLVPALGLEDVA